jgi:hypothetical protein
MSFNKFVFALAAAGFFSTGAAAGTYVCELEEHGGSGWIPETVVVKQSGETVTVFDPLIKHYAGEPIEGKVAVSNDRRITFSWDLGDFSHKGRGRIQNVSGFVYRLTIRKAALTATISAKPLPFDNSFSGAGDCELKP